MFNAQEYQSILRSDFATFIERSFRELNPQTEFQPNWHIDLIADRLERCRRAEINRLIINVPPRSAKSHCASVAYPAWVLGHNPSEQIICASYAQDLSDTHATACRTLMTSPFYCDLFPTRLSSQKSAVSEFHTVQRGYRMSTSRGGALTGRGANIIIIDDILKPDEATSDNVRQAANEWFSSTLYTRLNDKRTGCIILIMQRLHEDDAVGYAQKLEDWHILRLPAIAEEDEAFEIDSPSGRTTVGRRTGEALHAEREPLEVLARVKSTVGEYNFAGQYQQSPAPLGGGMVKLEWFKTYTDRDLPSSFDQIFQSWDTANKASELSDFSVCTTWAIKGKNIYLLNVLRKRLDYPFLKKAVREQATAFRPKVILIEDSASGTQLIQQLIADGIHGIKRYRPKMDKVMRMHSVTSTIENRFVYLPETAPWLAEYCHELTVFPKGKYDDQVDSTSQALDWIKEGGYTCGIFQFWELESKKIEAENAKPAAYNFKNLPDGWLDQPGNFRRFRRF